MRAARGLTKKSIQSLQKPGVYADGNNLYMQLKLPNARSWLFRYRFKGHSHSVGLGSVDVVSLDEAREKALTLRRQLHAAHDPEVNALEPLAAKRAKQAAMNVIAPPAPAVMPFAQAAALYIKQNEGSWKSRKHGLQWTATLKTYAFPLIGALDVAEIDATHIAAVLLPIWTTKIETSNRLRGRLEAVLDFAKANRWRSGDNPAVYKDHLQHALPGRAKVEAGHHAALPWREVPAFMADLAKREGIAAKAVAFAVLTAARSGEIRGATWSEIDLEAGLWTVPAARMKGRMKGGKAHTVSLSAAALAVLRSPVLGRQTGSDLVFNGMNAGSPLSDMSLTAVLRRMSAATTMHGLARSSFADWAADCTTYSKDVADLCLSHTVGSKVSQAYMRTTMPKQRKALLDEWSAYCCGS